MARKAVTQMHEFSKEMKKRVYFTSVSIGDHVYVMIGTLLYRLKYSDNSSTWDRMANLIEDHGERPPAVTVSKSIVIAGGSEPVSTSSVVKYDPTQNKWEKLANRPRASRFSANVACQGCLYCIGGLIKGFGITNEVEKFDFNSQSWLNVSPMKEVRSAASAVAWNGKILVAGGENRQLVKSAEMYDVDANQWTALKPMTFCRYGSRFRCHLINNDIYAVGHHDKGIEKYDIKRDEWEVVKLPGSVQLQILESVTAQIAK